MSDLDSAYRFVLSTPGATILLVALNLPLVRLDLWRGENTVGCLS